MHAAIEVEEVNKNLKAFWELEALGILEEKSMSRSDEEIIAKHNSTIQFREGRYEVQLPWNERPDMLRSNFALSSRRMQGLVKKFQRSPALYQRYQDTFEEYLRQGIIEEVSPELIHSDGPKYYIPHFPVIREDKKTTKFRIVYDAAAHEKGQPSLNSLLSPGPNLNPDLLLILMRFRMGQIAIMADIEKAFLMISLASEDREFCRFLWIKSMPNGAEPVENVHFRMARVLFGVSSSPFLLAATLKYHFALYQDQYPEACSELTKSLYVDDLVCSVTSIEEAKTLYSQSTELLNKAGMNLRKWISNSKELSECWNNEAIIEEKSLSLTAEASPLSQRVLGISWDPHTDQLTFNVTPLLEFLETRKNTKRSVLQATARIFDPIGFLSPFLIRAKCLFQKLWIEGVDWDTELPLSLSQEWRQWCSELSNLRNVAIPRWYYEASGEEITSKEIHVFCDASKHAYGAVTYLRYQTKNGEVGVSLITSKTRVSPIKEVKIPRLELMAAVIGSRLLKYTLDVFEGEITTYYCWSDSTIVIQWIQTIAREWKPFVANRVAEIHKLTEPSSWGHCAGKTNPADYPSRGTTIEDLLVNKVWWQGPPWLTQDKSSWPRGWMKTAADTQEADVERRATCQLASHVQEMEPIIKLEDYSSLRRVLRVTAWVIRFTNNIRKHAPSFEGPLNAQEMDHARKLWIRQVQSQSFPEEIARLTEKLPLSRTSKILQYNPFLQEGLLRVGGRLQNSTFEFQVKHPYLLPSKHKLAELMTMESHYTTMHGGLNNTLTQLREEVWVLQGRQMVKRVIGKCIVCRRFKVKKGDQVTAPLPLDRIRESPPFTVTGIDFAGPLYARVGKGTTKVYIALFTCGVTRAIHLELVTDLSAEKFMLAFRRFVARRGVCCTIYSDNAKTFKRTDQDLKRLYQNIEDKPFQEYLGNQQIRWKYIVERAAWWGGFWERLVRSVKMCLKKTLGKNSLSYEELTTSLTEIEAVINSRPLTNNETDPEELSPLTPSHFLIGQRATAVPDQIFQGTPSDAKKDQLTRRLRHRQVVINQFWKRWRNHYLLELRSAHSSRAVPNPTTFKVNDIVLLDDSKLPRQIWRMGRITQTYPGRDGKIRACSLRLPGGVEVRRAVQSLYNLEVDKG